MKSCQDKMYISVEDEKTCQDVVREVAEILSAKAIAAAKKKRLSKRRMSTTEIMRTSSEMSSSSTPTSVDLAKSKTVHQRKDDVVTSRGKNKLKAKLLEERKEEVDVKKDTDPPSPRRIAKNRVYQRKRKKKSSKARKAWKRAMKDKKAVEHRKQIQEKERERTNQDIEMERKRLCEYTIERMNRVAGLHRKDKESFYRFIGLHLPLEMRSEWYVFLFFFAFEERTPSYYHNFRYEDILENDVVHMQGFLLRVADGEPFTRDVVTASSSSPQNQIEEANEVMRKIEKAENNAEETRIREMITRAQSRGLSGRLIVNSGRKSSSRLNSNSGVMLRKRSLRLSCDSSSGESTEPILSQIVTHVQHSNNNHVAYLRHELNDKTTRLLLEAVRFNFSIRRLNLAGSGIAKTKKGVVILAELLLNCPNIEILELQHEKLGRVIDRSHEMRLTGKQRLRRHRAMLLREQRASKDIDQSYCDNVIRAYKGNPLRPTKYDRVVSDASAIVRGVDEMRALRGVPGCGVPNSPSSSLSRDILQEDTLPLMEDDEDEMEGRIPTLIRQTEGLEALIAVMAFSPSLLKLNLRDNSLNQTRYASESSVDLLVKFMKSMEHNKVLVDLDISENSLQSVSARYISKMLCKNQCLRRLNLSGTYRFSMFELKVREHLSLSLSLIHTYTHTHAISISYTHAHYSFRLASFNSLVTTHRDFSSKRGCSLHCRRAET
jgi:hypothetical protein